MTLAADVCRRAESLIAARLGLHFPESRRPDLERGLIASCKTRSMPSAEQYLGWLALLPEDNPEWRRLAARLTVGETYFFRDAACFAALEQEILPDLIAARRSQGTLRLRLWSAGCASGEEAYSLAIVLDRLLPDRERWALTILATDINTDALAAAQRGLYREWSFRETPGEVTGRYFTARAAGTFEIDPRIRQMVTFAPLNLAADVYPSTATNTAAMDVVLCRNVVMYFTPEVQQATIARLVRALVRGGWLAVSAVETSTERFAALARVDVRGGVFHRSGSAAVELRPPVPWWSAGDAGPGNVGDAVYGHPHETETAPDPARTPTPPGGSGVPDTPSVLVRARMLADRGDLDQARRLCERALAHARLDPELPLLLAAVCQEQGDVRAALDALRRGIYLAPDSALAYFLRGSLELRRGDVARGRRSLETAARLLGRLDRDAIVAGSDGLKAAGLLDATGLYLEAAR